MWRPTAYRLAGGHNQSALNTASYDLKCEATREMFVDEELMAQADYLVRPMPDPSSGRLRRGPAADMRCSSGYIMDMRASINLTKRTFACPVAVIDA